MCLGGVGEDQLAVAVVVLALKLGDRLIPRQADVAAAGASAIEDPDDRHPAVMMLDGALLDRTRDVVERPRLRIPVPPANAALPGSRGLVLDFTNHALKVGTQAVELPPDQVLRKMNEATQ